MDPLQPATPPPPPSAAEEGRESGPPAASPRAPEGHPESRPSLELPDLVRRAQRGDRQAQERIVRVFETRVLRLAVHMVGNRADAEDVAQEAFMQIFRRLERLDSRRDPTGWVVRVTMHTCCDFLNRRRRQALEPLPDLDLESSDPGPSLGAQQAQQRRILQRSLRILTPQERAVFILHEVEGEDAPLIARSLRISRITVRRHLSRARQRLRRYLHEHHPQLL